MNIIDDELIFWFAITGILLLSVVAAEIIATIKYNKKAKKKREEMKKMAYRNRCPYCGSYLDPEEVCECQAKDHSEMMKITYRRKLAKILNEEHPTHHKDGRRIQEWER